MSSWRSILGALVLLRCLLAQSAQADDAVEHYYARLLEISHSYNRQFSEIRKNQRRLGSNQADIKLAEGQIKQLALMRDKAIAEAALLYTKELREQKQTDLAPPPRLSREQQENEDWAAQKQAFEDGQKAFWARVAREEGENTKRWAAQIQATEDGQTAFWAKVTLAEPQNTKLWAARVQKVEDEQAAFWADIFQPPKTLPPNRPPMPAILTGP